MRGCVAIVAGVFVALLVIGWAVGPMDRPPAPTPTPDEFGRVRVWVTVDPDAPTTTPSPTTQVVLVCCRARLGSQCARVPLPKCEPGQNRWATVTPTPS